MGSSLPLLLPPFLSFLSRKICCQAQVWWQLQGEETFGPGMEFCQLCLLGQLGPAGTHLSDFMASATGLCLLVLGAGDLLHRVWTNAKDSLRV